MKQAYDDVPKAFFNENIYETITKWNEVDFDIGKNDEENVKALEEILFENGWTDVGLYEVISLYNFGFEVKCLMFELVGKSSTPIPLYPLGREDFVPLSAALRYRVHLSEKRETFFINPDIPEKWLDIVLKHKRFGKTG